MNLEKSGKLFRDLRRESGLTQDELAKKIGVCAKTVSKWECGRGFPDVETVAGLAKIFGVSTDVILSGSFLQNAKGNGDMKKIKFYLCPDCGNMLTQTGVGKVFCCGKELCALTAQKADSEHTATVQSVEDEYYITLSHDMTKSHYISFAIGQRYDSVLIIKLYPEQNPEIRLPKTYGGKIYACCSKHGLFEIK